MGFAAAVFSRQQKLEKVMDQEGLADEEVSGSSGEVVQEGEEQQQEEEEETLGSSCNC